MTVLNDVNQKLKGKAQKVKGQVQQEMGQGVKGGITKIKGHLNETLADIKLKSRY